MQEAKLHLQPQNDYQLTAESPVPLKAVLIISIPNSMLHAMNGMEERHKAEVFKSCYTQNMRSGLNFLQHIAVKGLLSYTAGCIPVITGSLHLSLTYYSKNE